MPPTPLMLTPAQLAKLQAFKVVAPPPKQKKRKGGGLTLALVAAVHAEGLRQITPWGLYQRIVALGETGKWPKIKSTEGWLKTCGDLLGDHLASLTPIGEVEGEGTARAIPDDFDLARWIEANNIDASV